MGQHFAEKLGVYQGISGISDVDKPKRKAQHVAIGIHLGAVMRVQTDDTNENLEHKYDKWVAVLAMLMSQLTP